MENKIKTLSPPVFLSKIVCGECITPPLLKFRNQSSSTVLHVYSTLYTFFQWDESTCCIQHGSAPPFSSVFTSREGTLSLTHRQVRDRCTAGRSDREKEIRYHVPLKRLAIMCTSLYSCAREILGSLLNRVTTP